MDDLQLPDVRLTTFLLLEMTALDKLVSTSDSLNSFIPSKKSRILQPLPQPVLTHLWLRTQPQGYRHSPTFAMQELLAYSLPTLTHLVLVGEGGRMSTALGRVLEDAPSLSTLRSICLEESVLSIALRCAFRKAFNLEYVFLRGQVVHLLEVVEDCTTSTLRTKLLTVGFFTGGPALQQVEKYLGYMKTRGVGALKLHVLLQWFKHPNGVFYGSGTPDDVPSVKVKQAGILVDVEYLGYIRPKNMVSYSKQRIQDLTKIPNEETAMDTTTLETENWVNLSRLSLIEFMSFNSTHF